MERKLWLKKYIEKSDRTEQTYKNWRKRNTKVGLKRNKNEWKRSKKKKQTKEKKRETENTNTKKSWMGNVKKWNQETLP